MPRPLRSSLLALAAACFSLVPLACSGSSSSGDGPGDVSAGDDSAIGDDVGIGLDGDFDSGLSADLRTCEGAKAAHSYIGCDYWPTVVANSVWSIFDYAVVVANAGTDPSDVTITGPNGVSITKTIAPQSLEKIYLPWVAALKGPDSDACGDLVNPIAASVVAKKSAYHLVSSRPVTVYQFNALEYRPEGGPAGKDWSSCPGAHAPASCQPSSCFSYTNDASLLLPTTALTGNYRVAGIHGWSRTTGKSVVGAYFAVTATQDGTTVRVKVSSKGTIVAGSGVAATSGNAVLTLTLDAGDVAQLLGAPSKDSDLSGSLVEADKPVQVITGAPCIEEPIGVKACDHVEESNFPIETTGKHYVVTAPSGPSDAPVAQTIRIVGDVDGTKLTYAPAAPPNAPTSLAAGAVFEVVSTSSFEVTGDQPFSLTTFTHGADEVDPNAQRGDPAQSLVAAVEQYRKHYVFLAPDDYQESYADIVVPTDTKLTLDGAPIADAPTAITSAFGVVRVKLGPGTKGAHVLDATRPVGMQIIGYGSYTSYQYPAGLNLEQITPPPAPIR